MPAAQVVEVAVAVQVPAAGFLVAKPQVERRGARVVVGNAEPGLMAAAVAGEGLGGLDGASGPEDFTLADRNAVRPGDQERGQAPLLAREPPGMVPIPAGGIAGLQEGEISFPALPDLRRSVPSGLAPATFAGVS